MKILICFVLSTVMTFWCAFGACGSPEIKISYVTPYLQSECKVEGAVKGVDPSLYKVAVYIKVRDSWWTKPAFSSPLTTIDGSGYWKCRIDTGENDRFATAVKALLVPLAIDPATIRCGPCCDVPDFSGCLRTGFRSWNRVEKQKGASRLNSVSS